MTDTAYDVAEAVYNMMCEGCPREKNCQSLNSDGWLEGMNFTAMIECLNNDKWRD